MNLVRLKLVIQCVVVLCRWIGSNACGPAAVVSRIAIRLIDVSAQIISIGNTYLPCKRLVIGFTNRSSPTGDKQPIAGIAITGYSQLETRQY